MGKKNNEKTRLNNYIILTIKEKNPKTIQQLVEILHQQYLFPKKEILTHILELQKQGKLDFKEDTTYIPPSLKNYLKSTHSYWYLIIIALIFTTVTIVFTIPENAIPLVFVRHILGSIFVLFLPGYSLTKALFLTKELDYIERIALSIGISLAIVPITALILNYTPFGIRTDSLTISLLFLTIIFTTAALIREHQNKTFKR